MRETRFGGYEIRPYHLSLRQLPIDEGGTKKSNSARTMLLEIAYERVLNRQAKTYVPTYVATLCVLNGFLRQSNS